MISELPNLANHLTVWAIVISLILKCPPVFYLVLKGWHCSDSPVFYFKLALVVVHQQRTPSGNVSTLFLGSIPSETNFDFVFSPSSLPPIIATCSILSSVAQVKRPNKKAGIWEEEHLCAVAHACFSFMLYALSGKPRQQVHLSVRQPWQISFSCWSVPPDFLQSNQKKMMWWNYRTSISHSYYNNIDCNSKRTAALQF